MYIFLYLIKILTVRERVKPAIQSSVIFGLDVIVA